MDRDPAAALDLEGTDPADLFEHFERDVYEGLSYQHLSDARHGVERGTAIVEGEVVRGYPSIPRTLVFDPGVPDYFEGPVAVEEKYDGYNVRIARVAGRTLAFTRSGYVCPYTTGELDRLIDAEGFFSDHPGQMLCCEVVGTETPYTDHDYPEVEGVGCVVFDVRDRETGRPVPVADRRERCDAYDLPQVRSFGTSDRAAAVETVRDAIETLDAEGREGVVVQSLDGARKLKYTTSAIHRSDLEHAFALPFDYGRDFLLPRLLREAFQAVEFGEDERRVRERARDLGEAVLLPAVETIRAVEAGEPVGETHTVRGDPATVEATLSFFRDQGLELVVEADERADGEREVTFTKVAASTRDKTEYYLSGGTRNE